MKLPRPYIPLSVRIEVAKRQILQLADNGRPIKAFPLSTYALKLIAKGGLAGIQRAQLNWCLGILFGKAKAHLDHDPPLCLREYNPKTKQYVPDANDPNYLRYVNAESHRIKTYIRGEGARRSDMGQRRYLKRVHAKRTPKPRFKPRAAKQIRRIPHASVTTNDGD